MNIVFLGLSITSSWGNGHATTYRGLIKALTARGHKVLFLERDQRWYAENRDLARPGFGQTELYGSLSELTTRWKRRVADADLVVVGSYVPDGVRVGEWVQATASGPTAFYDIDTPVTLAKLAAGDLEYISAPVLRGYDLYLSFTGGPTLRTLEKLYGAQRARVLYCSVDPDLYFPEPLPAQWDLGYLGTFSQDRQPALEQLMCRPADLWPEGRFCVAGSLYPDSVAWPANIHRIHHLPPADHRHFYNGQRWTLNITRADMVRAGYSPSVRLFEAGACGTPIISDRWKGLDDLFEPDREIRIADTTDQALDILRHTTESERRNIGDRARRRVLARHTA
ncbi:MAG TPA: glycosyltransferase, partial [Bryobacteraceae bacterium]|nr:glycosyltransferase [Bryobacteraceae bacterium]